MADQTKPQDDEAIQIPAYKSFKTVRAVKIRDVTLRDEGRATIIPDDDRFPHIQTIAGWADRFKGDGDDLGYFVRYEDGYESWSPTKAFEGGYERITE